MRVRSMMVAGAVLLAGALGSMQATADPTATVCYDITIVVNGQDVLGESGHGCQVVEPPPPAP